jgi:hypothetical protein
MISYHLCLPYAIVQQTKEEQWVLLVFFLFLFNFLSKNSSNIG